MYKAAYKYASFLPLLLFLLYLSACEKEYSYEGGNVPPPVVTLPVDSTDSIGLDPGELPSCSSCSTSGDIPPSSWSFRIGNSLLCGEVDTSIMLSLERNTFTFFGPSTCAADTGLIFTVSLNPYALDRDITNITASNAIFYYYHTYAPYILTSHANQSFRFTITSYDHTTKLITGTFSGTGYRQDGGGVNVTDGKFKFKII